MIYHIVGGDMITPKAHTRQFLVDEEDFRMPIKEVMQRVNTHDDMQLALQDCKLKLQKIQFDSLQEHDRLTDQMLTMYTYDDMKEHGERLLRKCVEIAESVSHRSDDTGAIIANSIKRQFGL